MKQVWAKTDVLFGITEFGHAYLADYPLMLSGEDHMVGKYTPDGIMHCDYTEGVDALEIGSHYIGNLTIFQDDEAESFRFSSVRRVELTND